MAKYISYIFSIFIIFAGCDSSEVIIVPIKPDLIIESITYSRLPSCYSTPYGGVICGGPLFQYTLKIKNVGNAELNTYFYVSNTRSNRDFKDKSCGHTIRVNNPVLRIAPNEFIYVAFDDYLEDSTSNILFVINTNNRFVRGFNLPIIDELNYDNNSYTLNVNW